MRSTGWKKNRVAKGMAVAALLLASVATALTQEKPFPELNEQLQPLKEQFNSDVGKVRVLVIVDPT